VFSFSTPGGAILGRLGEVGSTGAKSEDVRLEGIELAEVGEVGFEELMSIASLLEWACEDVETGGRGFCLP